MSICTWTTVPADVAATDWEPPNHMNTQAPSRFVERVRELLETGEYRQVIASDGLAFVGTAQEVEQYMLSREAFFSTRVTASPPVPPVAESGEADISGSDMPV
jgi:hypothetical protein